MLSIQRKLRTLKYHSPEHFSLNSEEDVKNIIYWTENQKIRYYPVKDRTVLRNETWKSSVASYFKELKCPYSFEKFQNAAIDWLLNYAIRLEYSDEKDNINEKISKLQIVEHDCPPLDVNSVQFKNGVNILRDYLRIPPHQDYLEVLKACRILLEKRVGPNAIIPSGDKMTLGQAELGFDLSETSLNEAGKALRLLHVEELRILQTQINEAIVAAQSQTADPKTDASLGKVGRM